MNCRELSGAEDGSAEVPDYLEATVFSKEEAVIMVGNFADVKTAKQVEKGFRDIFLLDYYSYFLEFCSFSNVLFFF